MAQQPVNQHVAGGNTYGTPIDTYSSGGGGQQMADNSGGYGGGYDDRNASYGVGGKDAKRT